MYIMIYHITTPLSSDYTHLILSDMTRFILSRVISTMLFAVEFFFVWTRNAYVVFLFM